MSSVVIMSCSTLGGDKKKTITFDVIFEAQSHVYLIQELVKVSHDSFQTSYDIPWDATIFDIDNGNVPLNINMQDVYEIIYRSWTLQFYNYGWCT